MYEGKKNIQQKYLCANFWVCHRRRIYCFKKSFLHKIIAFFADRFVPLDGHSTTWRINQLVFERLGSLNYLANRSAGIWTTRISQLPGESISWYSNDADLCTTWRIDQLVSRHSSMPSWRHLWTTGWDTRPGHDDLTLPSTISMILN